LLASWKLLIQTYLDSEFIETIVAQVLEELLDALVGIFPCDFWEQECWLFKWIGSVK
jgi:hypothetical protein